MITPTSTRDGGADGEEGYREVKYLSCARAIRAGMMSLSLYIYIYTR